MRAAEHCPVSILQARGVGACPEVALWTTERFVAVTSTLAVELPYILHDAAVRSLNAELHAGPHTWRDRHNKLLQRQSLHTLYWPWHRHRRVHLRRSSLLL